MTTRIAYNHARPTTSRLEELYRSVGWSTYLAPGRLDACLNGSLWFEAAWAVSTTLPTSSGSGASEPELVGLIRVVGDDASIAYVQDLLVKPNHQRRGIATRIMRDAFKRFEHVRQFVLLTDDTAASRAFYESLGLVQVASPVAARSTGRRMVDCLIVTTGPRAYRRQDGIAIVPLALRGRDG